MIVRFSVYNTPDPWGDGGARRTVQIGECLAAAGTPPAFIPPPPAGRRLQGLASLLGELGFMRRHRLPIALNGEFLFTAGNDLRYFRDCLRRLPPRSLLLWESTHSRFAALPFLAKEYGHRVIALPHNLESLVPSNRSFVTAKVAPDWLPEELQALAACDRVFAISREDQWLLRLHGIAADYLPYRPPAAVAAAMTEIRTLRQAGVPGRDLLLLGTVGNPPTYLGMKDRLAFFAAHADSFDTLHVAGYGTERLRDAVPDSMAAVLHGGIDNDRLHALMRSTRAAIIHQVPSTGALTRIPELLLAGIPVLANVDAARSYFNQPGVHVYENDLQLLALLAGPLGPVAQPVFPAERAEDFLQAAHE